MSWSGSIKKWLSEKFPGPQPKAEVTARVLCKALENTSEKVSREAAATLVTLGAAAVEPLCATLMARQVSARTRAAEALGKIGDQRAVDALCRALGDPNEYVRIKAVGALGKIGDARALG